jgi:type IV fimbrial biogenesis protein FimT
MDAAMHRSQCRSAASAGFTLIELAVVLVLMGILLVIAAPSMASYIRSTKVDGALNALTGDIAYARMLAVRSGRAANLTIGPGGTVYTINTVQSSGSVGTAKRVDLGSEYPGLILSPSGVLNFSSRGLLMTGGPSEITAQQNGTAASLQILPNGRAYRVY